MAYRFVHTADIHLDSPLRSLALRDQALADLVGTATRRTLGRIVDLCLREKVDALLVAGDLYDDEQTSMKTARFLAEQMRRLDEAGIRVFVIRGNHDAISRITAELTLPGAVKVFGGRAEAVDVGRPRGAQPIVVHGLSFAERHAPESLVDKFLPPVEDAVNIGLLHTSLGGAAGHSPYAPCSVADLVGTGFRYWALGHIHQRSATEGGCTVVMPGMPQGRDIGESGAKSVTLATVGDDGSIRIEERPIGIAQFERIAVDATGLADWRDLVEAVARRLEAGRAEIASEHLVARLCIAGATPLAWRLRRDADLLKTEAEHCASALDGCWIEAVEVACRPPLAPAVEPGDPLVELHRLVGEEIVGSEAFRLEIAAIAKELQGQLPPEARTILGLDEAAFSAALADLAREGAEDVLARLDASRRPPNAA
jgi:DNA repair exonuclease SbcCD nuclease subunit